MKLFIVFIFLSLHPGAFAQSESYQKIVRVLEKAHKGDKLSATEMKSFLCAYEKEYINNTELGEYRNETLFQVIASDNASFFLSLLKKKKEEIILRVFSDLQNPIHDAVDLENCLRNLQSIKKHDKLRKRMIDILE